MCLPEILKDTESEVRMTREEAILIIGEHKKNAERLAGKTLAGQKSAEAFNMAIEALSTSEIPNKCDDAISRQAVLDLIYNSWKHNGVGENYGELSIDALKALPSVTPKQKMGHWEMCEDADGIYGVCDICGTDADFSHYEKAYPYCPNCGAKMAESEDTE